MKRYIRERKRTIIFFLIVGVIFALSFYLYRLPLLAVLYPYALCSFGAVVFLLIDYQKMKQQWKDEWEKEQESKEKELEYQEQVRQFGDMMDYFTTWVHQIKTPISSMHLTLQNQDTPLSRYMLTELFFVEQYVEMVLAYLRLGSASSDYVLRDVPIDGVIKEVLRKLSRQFIEKKLTLSYEGTEYVSVSDEKWLAFVIEQILTNAIKYTKKGGITITVSEEGVLQICDTGMGIAPEDLPRIFQKGYTGYNGRSDKKASGLGLYLTKQVCNNLKHEISVSSKVGSGTCVQIQLTRPAGRLE
ncbi:MAG: HAMP domain-containing histidine kinase [Lachnospiraceae bacterium]|nr:HAMP domain-containing histidine kinase [Lachnospiraceae bacterium]